MSGARAREEWDRPRSPCTKVCALDEQGYCVGCLRTADEIGRWTSMSAAEQWRVVAELKQRREARCLIDK